MTGQTAFTTFVHELSLYQHDASATQFIISIRHIMFRYTSAGKVARQQAMLLLIHTHLITARILTPNSPSFADDKVLFSVCWRDRYNIDVFTVNYSKPHVAVFDV